jgi:hypothetical protein
VLHEACVQLRGDGGERQVKRPVEVAAVSNGGGPIAGGQARRRRSAASATNPSRMLGRPTLVGLSGRVIAFGPMVG